MTSLAIALITYRYAFFVSASVLVCCTVSHVHLTVNLVITVCAVALHIAVPTFRDTFTIAAPGLKTL